MKTISKSIFASCLLLMASTFCQAQVGIGTNSPDASAKLELSSTTQGFLPPRMTTTQRDAISTPATGLVIFNTSTNGLEFKASTGWVSLTMASAVNATTYHSVLIGAQKWMEKNLEVTTYRNGDIIPYVTDPTTWSNLTTGAWCYYNNDPSSGYGKLYNWYAVNDPRGLAPTGWHIPTDVEWTTLGTTLGGDNIAGGKLKTAGTTRWLDSNVGATNESGFAGLPGGFRGDGDGGVFAGISNSGYWWTATEDFGILWSRHLINGDGALFSYNFLGKYAGLSVRCLRD